MKKIFSGLALAAATVCGCMTLCFGTYAVWNYVVKPIVIEEKKPEQPVTTQTFIAAQTQKPTETTATAVTTVSSAEVTTETTTKVTTTTEPYEEELYTEAAMTTTAVTAKRKMTWNELQLTPIYQTYYRMDEYITQNDIDVVAFAPYGGGEPEDVIEIWYINEQGKNDIEKYIGKYIGNNKISRDCIKIEAMEEMDHYYRYEYVWLNKINSFIRRNDLSCQTYAFVAGQENGIDVKYDASHEEDKNALEAYITEHGYDQIMPIVYTPSEPPEQAAEMTAPIDEPIRESDDAAEDE